MHVILKFMMGKTVRNASNAMLIIFGTYPALYMLADRICSGHDPVGGFTQCPIPGMAAVLMPAEYIVFFYLFGLIFIAVPTLLVCFVLSLIYEWQQTRATNNFPRPSALIPIASLSVFLIGFADYLLKLLAMYTKGS